MKRGHSIFATECSNRCGVFEIITHLVLHRGSFKNVRKHIERNFSMVHENFCEQFMKS